MLYRRSRTALTRTVGDVVLVAIPEREGFEKLAGTSATAWHLLETPVTAGELTADLATLYGVEPGEVAGSVAAMLDAFVGRALAEEVATPVGGTDG